jgi:hypothetical protein
MIGREGALRGESSVVWCGVVCVDLSASDNKSVERGMEEELLSSQTMCQWSIPIYTYVISTIVLLSRE